MRLPSTLLCLITSLAIVALGCASTSDKTAAPTTPSDTVAAAEAEPVAEAQPEEPKVPRFPGKWVWYELINNDLDAAQKFYTALFGWTVKSVDEAGANFMIYNGETPIGGMIKPADVNAINQWMPYVSVEDVDAKATWVSQNGGIVKKMPMEIPGERGRFAVVSDPQGAYFTVFNYKQGDPPDTMAPPPGSFVWTELWARDPDKAVDFYKEMLGYSADAMPMPDGVTYNVLKTENIPRAGIMKIPNESVPAMWMPYIAVADCDATLKLAKESGAKIIVKTQDVPNVGRFAILKDPTGSMIAVMQPAPMPATPEGAATEAAQPAPEQPAPK